MNAMQGKHIKELGLSPLWVRKNAPAAVTSPTPAAAPSPSPSPPPSPPPPSPATPAVTSASAPTPAPAMMATAAAADSPKSDIAAMNWQQLRQTAEACRLCGLCEKRRKVAFGTGDQQAKVMFIGEGPGEDEDRQGEPFVGRAGKLLDLMLHAIELHRTNNVYIANIVKCRPPGNRNPTPEEASTCLPYLQRQIALVKPDLLVALGKVAAIHLLQIETSIAQLRQQIHTYHGTPLVVTYHPAYLLRSPQEKRKSWEDLKFIRSILNRQDT